MEFLVSFSTFIWWFFESRLLKEVVLEAYCGGFVVMFTLPLMSCETQLPLPVYILLIWSFVNLNYLGRSSLYVEWMTNSIFAHILLLRTWNVSSSCSVGRAISISFHWRFGAVPCGHASCTASRIRVFRSCWEPVIHAPLHHPLMVEYTILVKSSLDQ